MNKIRLSARGQNCTLTIEGVCNFNNETTVLAHVGRHGTAKRRFDDEHNAVYACSDCHDAIDYRTNVFLSDEKKRQKLLKAGRTRCVENALKRTRALLIDQGLA